MPIVVEEPNYQVADAFSLQRWMCSNCGLIFDFRDDYPISGVFVKYIVDNYGIEKLNSYYSKEEFVKNTNEIFKKSFDEFIDDYKNWLVKEFEQKKK